MSLLNGTEGTDAAQINSSVGIHPLENSRGFSTTATSPHGELLRFHDVEVSFPFQAYEGQKVFMEKVIQAVHGRTNALLESPTGTGKTLCLLCSLLAWQKQHMIEEELKAHSEDVNPADFALKRKTQVIYASRTHSQLQQVVRELRKTEYGNTVLAVLGSREQLCVHPEVKQRTGRVINALCRKMVASSQCRFHFSARRREKFPRHLCDIEDLVKWGYSQTACPYFMSREMASEADLILLPYAYLLDAHFRRTVGVELKDAILVFDEAHNIGSYCAESASTDLTAVQVAEAWQEVDFLLARSSSTTSDGNTGEKNNQQQGPVLTTHELTALKERIMSLESLFRLLQESFSSNDAERVKGITYKGEVLIHHLSERQFTMMMARVILKQIDDAIAMIVVETDGEGDVSGLSCVASFLRVVFDVIENNFESVYRFHVSIVEKKGSNRDGGGDSKGSGVPQLSRKSSSTQDVLSIGFWAQSASVTLSQMNRGGPRSILLTSGTLSPLEFFRRDLGIPFPIQLECPHVISAAQILCGVVCAGPSSVPLNSRFENRSTVEYHSELGNSLVNILRIVPDGLLTFFPSYSLMDQCIASWKQSSSGMDSDSVWNRMSRVKAIFVEPSGSHKLLPIMSQYYETVRSGRGAVFFAVCRGKVSEGLDFSDAQGRAVVVIGLPYPSLHDPKVRVHRDYLEQIRNRNSNGNMITSEASMLSGHEWYQLEAVRAVNQAIGRIIRHRHDYGAVLLLDHRFGGQNLQNGLSLWLRPHVHVFGQFGPVVRDLRAFFRACAELPFVKPGPTQATTFPPLPNPNEGFSFSSGGAVGRPSSFPAVPIEKSKVSKAGGPTGERVHTAKRQRVDVELSDVFANSRTTEEVEITTKHDAAGSPTLNDGGFRAAAGPTLVHTPSLGEKFMSSIRMALDTPLRPGPSVVPSSVATSALALPETEEVKEGQTQTRQSSSVRPQQPVSDNSREGTGLSSTVVPPTSTSTSTVASDRSRSLASEYLHSVEKSLSSDEFVRFKALLKQFKRKSIPLNELIEGVKEMFEGDKSHLRAAFRQFLPAHLQERYDENLMITARHETYTPTPSPPGPETSVDERDDVRGLERDRDSAGRRPVHPLRDAKVDMVTGKPFPRSLGTKHRPSLESLTRSTETGIQIRATASAEPVAGPQRNAAPWECPVCQSGNGAQPMAAKCGHVLCIACWDSMNKLHGRNLFCPVCRKAIRHRDLIKLYV